MAFINFSELPASIGLGVSHADIGRALGTTQEHDIRLAQGQNLESATTTLSAPGYSSTQAASVRRSAGTAKTISVIRLFDRVRTRIDAVVATAWVKFDLGNSVILTLLLSYYGLPPLSAVSRATLPTRG